jgi:hypothetical protein
MSPRARMGIGILSLLAVGSLVASCSSSMPVVVGKPSGKECSARQLDTAYTVRPGPRGTLRGAGDCVASLAGIVWPGFAYGDANAPSTPAADAIPAEVARLRKSLGVDFIDLPINAEWWLKDKRLSSLHGVPYVAYIEQVVQWITGAGVYVALAPVLGVSSRPRGHGSGAVRELEAFWESAAYRFARQPGVLYQLWWVPPNGDSHVGAQALGLAREVRHVDKSTTLIISVPSSVAAGRIALSGLAKIVLAVPVLGGVPVSGRGSAASGELCRGAPSRAGRNPERELAAWVRFGREKDDAILAGPMGSCKADGQIVPSGRAFRRGSALVLRAKLPILLGDVDSLMPGLGNPKRAMLDPAGLRLAAQGKAVAGVFHELR